MKHKYHLLVPATVIVWMGAVGFALKGEPAFASTPTFTTIQFNVCANPCTEDLSHHPSALNTHYGQYPMDTFLAYTSQSTFSVGGFDLNEMCWTAWTYLLAHLANPNNFSRIWGKEGTEGPMCGEIGTLVAARTTDKAYSDDHRAVHYFRSGGENESYALGTVSGSYFWVVGTHITTSGDSDLSLDSADQDFGNDARLFMGDYNKQPDDSYMENWYDEGWRDADAAAGPTYHKHDSYSNHDWHLDYTWKSFDFTVDRDGLAKPSASDHDMVISYMHAK